MILLLVIVILGVLCLVLDILNLRKAIIPVSITVLLGVLAMFIAGAFSLGKIAESSVTGDGALSAVSSLLVACYQSGSEQIPTYLSEMLAFDVYAMSFSALFVLLTIFVLSMVHYTCKHRSTLLSDIPVIMLFLLSGATSMVASDNFAMFFLGLEVLSIALYLLVGSNVKSPRSNEASMKYFIMGAFASCFILLGIALIYGSSGSFSLTYLKEFSDALSLSGSVSSWYTIGVMLILVGLLFKVSAVPFHFWAPDVYEGAPTIVTTLMSTLVKVVAVATLYKLLCVLLVSLDTSLRMVIVVVALLTMTVGNITAIRQTNIKRMLAYSGISHAGFMLLPLLALYDSQQNVLLYYAAAYSLAGIAAFSVVIAVCHGRGREDISMFEGLGRSHPLMATILSGALLSMAGIPFFSGFMAKFFLFVRMINIGETAVVIVGVLNSIVAVFYYFRIINVMFTRRPDATLSSLRYPISLPIVGSIAIVLVLMLGIFPSLLMY